MAVRNRVTAVGMSGRDRMMKSLDVLTGTPGECTEAVLMQQRPSWLPYMPLFLMPPLFLLALWADLPLVLAAGLAGGVATLPGSIITRYWIVGRTSDGVVLARSKNMRAKATDITKRLPYPSPARVDPGRMQRKVHLDGEEYFIARQFERRFSSIVGRG